MCTRGSNRTPARGRSASPLGDAVQDNTNALLSAFCLAHEHRASCCPHRRWICSFSAETHSRVRAYRSWLCRYSHQPSRRPLRKLRSVVCLSFERGCGCRECSISWLALDVRASCRARGHVARFIWASVVRTRCRCDRVPQQSLEGAVMRGSAAAGAGRQCEPAALVWRFWAAPQLHSKRRHSRVVPRWRST